ncbi:MAG TPA: hypothetical protein VK211_12155 [Kamptonema sp.]|nr:hypothetical protein [Kamptonema sp.]
MSLNFKSNGCSKRLGYHYCGFCFNANFCEVYWTFATTQMLLVPSLMLAFLGLTCSQTDESPLFLFVKAIAAKKFWCLNVAPSCNDSFGLLVPGTAFNESQPLFLTCTASLSRVY